MSKKVIISGATGMDGSIMADYLLKNTNNQIFGMVRAGSKINLENLNSAIKNERFKIVYADLNDAHSLNNLIQSVQPDYFINFAAQSFVGVSWDIAEQTFEAGALGVLRILEAIRRNAPFCRFYNAGSSEEFGDVEYSPQDENHPLRPQSPYGAAKAAARLITRVYRQSYNLYAIQGILFNHEGTRRSERFVTRKITKGVARIFHAIKNGQSFEPIVLGNLEAKRDWSDAEDFVDGVWRMLNQEKYNPNFPVIIGGLSKQQEYIHNYSPNVKEYILSSNETHSIREFIEAAFVAAGIKITDANPDRWPPTTDSKGQQINYTLPDGRPVVVVSREFFRPAEVCLLLGNSKMAKSELGWEPKASFCDLVKKMVKNDIDNYPNV